MSGKAHRGVLTSARPSHLCDEGKLEDFFRRQQSRVLAIVERGETRIRVRLRKLEYPPDEIHILHRGVRQPTWGKPPKES